jgi:hypothetical protein
VMKKVICFIYHIQAKRRLPIKHFEERQPLRRKAAVISERRISRGADLLCSFEFAEPVHSERRCACVEFVSPFGFLPSSFRQ